MHPLMELALQGGQIPLLSIPIPLIVSALGALSGYLGNRKGARTSTTDQFQELIRNLTDSTDIDITEEIAPFLSEEQQGFQSSLIREALDQLYRPDTQLDSIVTQGIRNINTGGDLQKTALARSLAARGLSRSPAAVSAIGNVEGQRIANISDFRSQAPVIADQLRRSNLDLISNIFARLPKGQRSSRTGTTTTTSTGSSTSRGTGTSIGAGSALGSGLGTTAQLLAYLYGQGAFGNQKGLGNI